jgi:hypothetical protein
LIGVRCQGFDVASKSRILEGNGKIDRGGEDGEILFTGEAFLRSAPDVVEGLWGNGSGGRAQDSHERQRPQAILNPFMIRVRTDDLKNSRGGFVTKGGKGFSRDAESQTQSPQQTWDDSAIIQDYDRAGDTRLIDLREKAQ